MLLGSTGSSSCAGARASPASNQQQQPQQRPRRLVAARLAAPRRPNSPLAAAAAGSAASPASPPPPAAATAALAEAAPAGRPSAAAAPAAAAAAAAAPADAAPPTDPPLAEAPKASAGGGGWWTKKPAARGTVLEIESAQGLVDVLADAGDRLVVLDVFAPWCGACKGVFPKIISYADQYAGEGPPDASAPGECPEDGVVFCKLNFDANRRLAKTLGVRVLPYFMFFRGAEGRVAAFSCTTSKLARLREALDFFSAGVCSLEPNPEISEISRLDIHPSHPLDATRVEHMWDLDVHEQSLQAPAE